MSVQSTDKKSTNQVCTQSDGRSPVCEAGRTIMCLRSRLAHYRSCRDPRCVARVAFYEQVREFVKENVNADRKRSNK